MQNRNVYLKNVMGKKQNNLVYPKRMYLFLIPALLVLLLFWFTPVLVMIISSFTKHSGSVLSNSTGLFDNYKMLFADKSFADSILHTVLYTAYLVIGSNLLGFLLAMAICRIGKGRTFFQFMLYLPAVLSTIVGSYVWSYIYMQGDGVLARLISLFSPAGSVNVLGNHIMALFILASIDIWKSFGMCMIIYLAAMKNIDMELISAAYVDGCDGLKTVWHVIIPCIYPGVIINVVLTLVNGLKAFDYSFIITNGGPGTSTTTLMYNVYKIAFTDGMVTKAYALSTVSLVFIAAVTVITVWFLNKKEDSYGK